MKVGLKSLKMSDGSIRQFKSPAARAAFEKYVQALKYGWKPKGKK
jgi:hypothetical protein